MEQDAKPVGAEIRLPNVVGRTTKAGKPGKSRPRGTLTDLVPVGYRVNPLNRDRFNLACHRLNLVQSEVIDTLMSDFWNRFAGRETDTRVQYENLEREASRLYDSLPDLRNTITHWDRFKRLYTETGGDTTEWNERACRLTLFRIYRGLNSFLTFGAKCPDCPEPVNIVQEGHFDADYRKFELYVMAKVKYADMNRKLKQLMEILIQREEGLADDLVEENAGEAQGESAEDATNIPPIAPSPATPKVVARRMVTITGRELAETIQPARVSNNESTEQESKARK